MNEFSHNISGRGIRPGKAQRRQMRHLHSRRHRFAGCGSAAAQDTRRRGRGERIHAIHELHQALAHVARTGDEQVRGEAAQILAEATSRLNGLLAADR
jgi:hypothetical protein